MNMQKPQVEIAPGRAGMDTIHDVYRCLVMLYSAHPGEQALDRDFGISTEALSKPMQTAKALMAAEFVAKTAKYEPRAQVQRVEWDQDAENGELIPKVVVQIVDD